MRGFMTARVACSDVSAVRARRLARAQGASIAGVVKDTSGAVLPGVTVEAASPVLIEKTREAVTDGSGQYKIINLLPGTYTVTFTLTGFSTVKREGVEVTGTSDGSDQRRHEGRHAGRNDHRHRRNAARRRAERVGAEGRDQGSHRQHSDRTPRHQPRGAPARA